MWRLSVAGISAAILALAAVSLASSPAYACSAGPDFDPIAASGVIVEGRFLGYEVLPDAPLPGSTGKGTNDAYIPIRVDMTVERVLKGNVASSTIAIIDRRTLGPPYPGHDEYEWIGASGACGAFDADPTGFYAIMGLSQNDDGTFGSSRFQVFYLGERPGGAGYDRALQRMASFPGAAALPALGSGPGASVSGPTATLTVAGIMAMMGTVLLSLVVLSRIFVWRST